MERQVIHLNVAHFMAAVEEALDPSLRGRPFVIAPEGAERAAKQPVVEPLSERGLEVLRLLESDLDGPEIAAHLFISVNTLRTHTRNVFAKLDVSSRRAAVSRAGELGLLARRRG